MSDWERLPRGTQRHTYGHITADVWRMGGGIWRWTVRDERTGVYLSGGDADSEDQAKDNATAVLLREGCG